MNRREIKEKRTRNSKLFENQDHSLTREIYLDAVHYEDEEGFWKEMDDTLAEETMEALSGNGETAGDFVNKKGMWKVRFKNSYREKKAVSVIRENCEISWALENARKVKAVKKDTKSILYPEVKPGLDCILRVFGENIKENLAIASPEAADELTYFYEMKHLEAFHMGNRIAFRKEDGEEFFSVAAPYMKDKNGAVSNAIDISLDTGEKNGQCRITFRPDKAWLEAPERSYPVIIDPVVTSSLKAAEIQDAHVDSYNNNDNYYNSIILKTKGGDNVQRSFLKFRLPEMEAADMVIHAAFGLGVLNGGATERTVQIHKVLQDWDSASITWNNKPLYEETVEDCCKYKADKAGWLSFDITRMVKDWYQNGHNFGLMMKDDCELAGYTEFLSSDCDNDYEELRPRIDIQYVNYSGLEDYWTYHSQSVGRAGTVHVNDYNGNLIMVHDAVSTEGSLMPAAVALVYNSTSRLVNLGYGYGFRLNYHQTLNPVTIGGKKYYKHIDEDGTELYFRYDEKDKKWLDESGQERELILNEGTDEPRVIKEKNGSRFIFNSSGFLAKIRDKNANELNISYSSERIAKITDGAGREIIFTYLKDSNGKPTNLSEIKDPAGRSKKITYVRDQITGITDVDGAELRYTYNSSRHLLTKLTNVDDYAVKYEYSDLAPYRVRSITEYGGTAAGNSLTISYGYNSTKFVDNKGRKEIYRFNNSGNLLHVHDDFGHAADARFNVSGNHVNCLENETKLQDNIVQLLKDPMIQAGKTAWKKKETTSTEVSASINTAAEHVKAGTRSLKLDCTSAADSMYWSQQVPVKKGETYTFSMYVKAIINELGSDGKGVIRIRYYDRDGAGQNADSEGIVKTTNDFIKMQTTCTVPKDSAKDYVMVYLYLYHAKGTMYGDMAQLEPGTTANRCNLVDNGDFHLGNISGFANPNTACDGLTEVGTEVRLPAHDALMVIKASAVVYDKPSPAGAQVTTVSSGQHLASDFRVDDADGNGWYYVKTSGGSRGYIQETEVLSYLSSGNGVNNGAVAVETGKTILRSAASESAAPVEEYIPKGTNVIILMQKKDDSGKNWYRVAMQIDGKRCHGYLPAADVLRFVVNCPEGVMTAADNFYKQPSLTAGTAGSAAKDSAVAVRGVVYKSSTETWYAVLKGKEFVYLPDRNIAFTEKPAVAARTKTTVAERIGELDSHIFKFAGDASVNKKLTKTIDMTGKKGDTYMVNAWGRGTALPETENDKDRRFGVEVVFVSDTDGVKDDVHYTNFSPDIMDWQFLSDAYVSKISYKEIKVSYSYCHNANLAFFDGLSLFREEFGQTYTYDAKNNLISVVDAQKQAQKFEYNENDDMTGIVDAKGNKFKFEYDTKRNPVKGTSAEGVIYTLKYDAKGNVVKSGATSPTNAENGSWITRAMTNNGNHVRSVTDAGNNTVKYYWDHEKDLVLNLTDARGSRIDYGYDEADRLISVEQSVTSGGAKQTVKNSYTYEKDRLTGIRHNGFDYGFGYDAFGNTLSVSIAGKQAVAYEYEAGNGNLLKTIYGNGDYIRYTYDKQDRMLLSYYKKSSGSAEQKLNEYRYDKQGNLCQVTAHMAGKTYRLYYDFLDRLMRVEDEQGTAYEYTYDENNHMVKMIHSSGSSAAATSYTYDRDGKEKTASPSANYGRTTAYDVLGRVSRQTWSTAAPFVTTYSYFSEGVNRYSMIKTMKNGSEALEYTYDPNGNISGIKDAAGTSTFVYDELNRLIRENNHVLKKTLAYEYDLGGNLKNVKEYAFTTAETLPASPVKTETGTYDTVWKDKLLNWNGISMTYDAIGNMLKKGSTAFGWTQGRKLESVNNGKNIQYFYDHTGARTKKTVDGTVTEYRMAGDLLVSEKTGTQTYWYRYDSGANLISVTIKGQIYFYVRNAQNDVIGLVDADGNTVVKYQYDSWGKLLGITGSLADTVGVQNPFRYRGYYYDNETGMYYLKSRYYDPEIRRFISADKFLSVVESLETLHNRNLYSYCNENPIVRSDENGAVWGTIVSSVGAFIGGCVVSIGAQMIFEGKSLKELNGTAVIMSGASAFMSFFGVNPVVQRIIESVGEVWSCTAEGESLGTAVSNIVVGYFTDKALKWVGIEAKGSWKDLTETYNMRIEDIKALKIGAIEAIPYYVENRRVYDSAIKKCGKDNLKSAWVSSGMSNGIPYKINRKQIGWGCRANGKTGEKVIYPIYSC